AQLAIRLPCEFDEKANHAVSDEESRSQEGGPVPPAPQRDALQRPQDEKQHDTLTNGFVQLRGVPRKPLRICWKDHCPWHRARSSVELSVDEVAEPTEEQSRRSGEGQRVEHCPYRDAVSMGEDRRRNHHSRN